MAEKAKQSDLLLKADQTALEAANAAISLKAPQTQVNGLEQRVNDIIRVGDIDPGKDPEIVIMRAGEATGDVRLSKIESGKRLSFFNVLKNKFDKSAITPGKYIIYTSGVEGTNASFGASERISIDPTKYHVMSGFNEQGAYYDINDNYISGWLNNAALISSLPPSNARWVRLSVPLAALNTAQFEEGTAATAYEAYKLTLNNNYLGQLSLSYDNLAYPGIQILATKSFSIVSYNYPGNLVVNIPTNTLWLRDDGKYKVAAAGGDFTLADNQVLCLSSDFGSGAVSYVVKSVSAAKSRNEYPLIYYVSSRVITSFPAYQTVIDKYFATPTSPRVLFVDKDGKGDYTTITAAVAAANDSVNPVTIMVNPGIYQESVYVGGSRKISIIGRNKKTCIIRDSTGLRENAPLEISGDAYIANMTFYATWTDESVVINNLGSYGVHVDYAGAGTCEFFNCDIISDCSSAIGAGTLDNQKIIFDNCYVRSNAKSNYMSAWYYAVFLHGSGTSSHVNQHYVMKNCEIHGVQDRLFRLANVGSDFDVTFINNMAWSKTIGKADGTLFLDGSVTITDMSYGNNVAALNK